MRKFLTNWKVLIPIYLYRYCLTCKDSFPTTDARKIIQEILHLKFDYMLHEDYAFYSYQEQYVMGDIVVMLSHEEDKGVLWN